MLPQNHVWQVDLRSWLTTLTVSDFECGLPGLTYDDAWLASADEVYRAWLTFENLGREITVLNGFKIAPEAFVLSSIEQGGSVYMQTYGLIEPGCLAWLYSWSYPGNPYHESIEIANRALVAAIVDMMMLWEATGHSQEKAAAFAVYGYVYSVCGHLLPVAVQDAYKEALSLYFVQFEAWVSTGTQADMDVPSILGACYAGQILGGDYPARAEAHALAVMDKHYGQAGFIDHGTERV